MKSTMLKRGAIFASVVLAALSLQAQKPGPDTEPVPQNPYPNERTIEDSTKEQMTEASFFKAASQINLLEVALADTATQKSQNAEVKKFAEMMRTDHTAANQKLQTIALKQNVTLETSLDTKHKQIQTDLEQKSGTEFDQAYATGMIKGHAKAIAKYQQAARLTDADVKKYATDTLPTLRKHLQHAKDLAKNVGVDESTIASAAKTMPEGVGGPSETSESETGSGKKSDQPKRDAQPNKEPEPDK